MAVVDAGDGADGADGLQMLDLYRCCSAFYLRNGGTASTICCPNVDITQCAVRRAVDCRVLTPRRKLAKLERQKEAKR